MTTALKLGDKIEWFSNRSFFEIWDLAFATAVSLDITPAEQAEISRFQEKIESGVIWSGVVLELDEEFPDMDVRTLWARLFLEVAQSVFLREIGDHTDNTWQVRAIVAAHRLGLFFEDAAKVDGMRVEVQTRVRTDDNEKLRKHLGNVP